MQHSLHIREHKQTEKQMKTPPKKHEVKQKTEKKLSALVPRCCPSDRKFYVISVEYTIEIELRAHKMIYVYTISAFCVTLICVCMQCCNGPSKIYSLHDNVIMSKSR